MNPVDHPHGVSFDEIGIAVGWWLIVTRVVTINILVRRLLSRDTPHKVKRRVLLLHGELVCYVVHKKPRIRWLVDGVFLWLGNSGFAFYVAL